MAKQKKLRDNEVTRDLIIICNGYADLSEVKRGVRALCRVYGGQFLYIPAIKTKGSSAEAVFTVLAEEVGERTAGVMLDRFMMVYGGMTLYIPFENHAFQKEIAQEIYERHSPARGSMSALASRYGISVVQAYNLWKAGQRLHIMKKQKALAFD